MRAGSGTGGLPQPFLPATLEILEIQSDKVAISIVLVSALRHLRESEQIGGPAIVKYVQLDAHGGWKLAQRRQEQRREWSCIPFPDMLQQPPGHWLQFEPLGLMNGPYLSV